MNFFICGQGLNGKGLHKLECKREETCLGGSSRCLADCDNVRILAIEGEIEKILEYSLGRMSLYLIEDNS